MITVTIINIVECVGCAKDYKSECAQSSQQSDEIGSIIIPIVQMGTPRQKRSIWVLTVQLIQLLCMFKIMLKKYVYLKSLL